MIYRKYTCNNNHNTDQNVFTASLVLIHGRVVHKSEQNKSQFSRHAYTFHVYDEGVSQYSEQNWLQTKVGFRKLYGQTSREH